MDRIVYVPAPQLNPGHGLGAPAAHTICIRKGGVLVAASGSTCISKQDNNNNNVDTRVQSVFPAAACQSHRLSFTWWSEASTSQAGHLQDQDSGARNPDNVQSPLSSSLNVGDEAKTWSILPLINR